MNHSARALQLRMKVMRIIVGSLLNSSMTDQELRLFAEEVDFEFLHELTVTLQRFGALAADNTPSPMVIGGEREKAEMAGLIYERVRQKRISKERLRSYLIDINPRLGRSVANHAGSTVDLVSEFVDRCTSDEAHSLMMQVLGETGEDPFLRGIAGRSED